MKRMLLVLTLVAILTAALLIGASAETTSGTCGENLTWKFENHTLTISGTGDMYDYFRYAAPWENCVGIEKWVIEEGVTSIGTNAFNTSARAMYGVVAASVKYVDEKAFANTKCAVVFLGDAPEFHPNAFEKATGQCAYISGWDEAVMQDYGGTLTWEKANLKKDSSTKMLYVLNEEISTEDFLIKASFSSGRTVSFSPQAMKLSSHDNSTPGKKTVSVQAHGCTFTHSYYVTDGQSHFDELKVDLYGVQRFTSREIKPEPTLTMSGFTLKKGVHYQLSYKNNINVGNNAEVIITGMGEWEGLSRTAYFTIVKRNISDATVTVGKVGFCGMPVTPESINVYIGGYHLTGGKDYVVYATNNVNMGTATYRVVGIGNYYGSVSGTFTIGDMANKTQTLNGNYNGQADGTLDTEKYYYQEIVWAPGLFQGSINATVGSNARRHVAYYQLYQMVGEEMVLIHEEQTEYGYDEKTKFTYDFSHVYEGSVEQGGEVYMLSYSWVDSYYSVYSGVCVIIVPAKVPDATQMVAEMVEGAGDFRYAHLTAYGLDGNVGNVTWTSSDPAVATVKDGVVTMYKPGLVTLTAQCGSMSASQTLMILPENLTAGQMPYYDAKTGKVCVYYDGYQLEEGKDYTQTVSTQDGITTVTVTGMKLFEGQLMTSFGADGHPVEHTHSFDNSCDTRCNSCNFVRTVEHIPGTGWRRNQTSHWHCCITCGAAVESTKEAHIVTPEQPDVCTVCGPLKVEGDLDGSCELDEDDVIYLLQHVLMPEDFPVDQSVDYDKNDTVDEDDVIYLLQHLLMPEDFPLS